MTRRDRKAARRSRRELRYFAFIVGTFAVAYIGSMVFRDSVAGGMDALLDLDSSQSPRSSALLGWAAGFCVLIYALIASVFKNSLRVLLRTWPIVTLLIVPASAFSPGRATTNRADDIATEYYFLGSFFDTYHLNIFGYLSFVVALIASALLTPPVDYEDQYAPELLAELRAGPDGHLFIHESTRWNRVKQSRPVALLRRALIPLALAGWVFGVLIYALTF